MAKTSRLLVMTGVVLAVLLHATSRVSHGNSANDGVVQGDLGAKLDRYFSRLAPFGFSGVVLVAKKKQILLHKGYGWADAQNRVPNTTQTVFDIASLTKQFTAAAILKLEMQGKLKTTDALGKLLPNVPPDKSAITVHQLLTHRSGLQPDFPKGKNISRAQFLAGILSQPLAAEPGKEYIYANSGYCLLAALVEELSGQPYPQFLAEQLYRPAGLTHTGVYDDRARWQGIAVAPVAHGYNEEQDTGSPCERASDWGVRGAYDALTNPGDLYQWLSVLQTDKVLSATERVKMFSVQTATGTPGENYGYGWNIFKNTYGRRLIGHGGSHFAGFNSGVRYFPDEDVLVIVTTNKIYGRYLPLSSVEPAIDALLFGGKFTEPPAATLSSSEMLQPLAGEYVLSSGATVTVNAPGDHLTLSVTGQEAIDLLLNASEQERKLLADFNHRAVSVFKAIAQADYGAVSKAFGGQFSPEDAKKLVGGFWQRFETQHGEFKSVDVLGTVPETEAKMTYVRLNFARGSEYRRCRWENGHLAYILQGAPPLLPTTFLWQSKSEFVGYHVVVGRTVQVAFERDSAGKVAKLAFQAGRERTVATRRAQ